MEQEEKNLLLIDLCARLPYGIRIECGHSSTIMYDIRPDTGIINNMYSIDKVKPYLRPMSSMTEEEKDFIRNKYFYEDWDSWNDLLHYHYHLINVEEIPEFMEWIYTHHFDFLNLIEKGLALEAPTNMYNN